MEVTIKYNYNKIWFMVSKSKSEICKIEEAAAIYMNHLFVSKTAYAVEWKA